MLLRFRTRVSLKRVACGAKIARFLAKNASFSRTRLSDGAVNSKWPNFETESKVADRDSSRDSLGRNCGRYWQKKPTF